MSFPWQKKKQPLKAPVKKRREFVPHSQRVEKIKLALKVIEEAVGKVPKHVRVQLGPKLYKARMKAEITKIMKGNQDSAYKTQSLLHLKKFNNFTAERMDDLETGVLKLTDRLINIQLRKLERTTQKPKAKS